jgi:polyisoprenyl-phosphate glycosyltransferase
MRLSVVVPCYNEQDVLATLHARLTGVCSEFEPYEIVLVDDGSRDQTWLRMRELTEKDNHVVAVRLSRNHGHQVALSAALDQAAGERIVIMDADLQDPPELLPSMMQMMDEGAEVVYARRRRRAGESRFKLATAHLFYRVLRVLSDVEIPEDTGDFRMISRRVADLLSAMPERHRYIRGMVSWLGFEQRPLFYDRDPRVAGVSQYPLKKMVRLAADGITSFSIKPLRVASVLAFILASFALAGLVFILFGWWLQKPVQGWASLAVTVLFLGAMQLFVLGIIGEYLGRLFIESKGRPLYLIAEKVGGQSSAAVVAPTATASFPR